MQLGTCLENDLAQRKGVLYCKIYSGNEGKNIEAYRNPPGVMSAEAYGLSREVVFMNTIILAKLDYHASSFYIRLFIMMVMEDFIRNNGICKWSLKLYPIFIIF
jgi:hypothetical protein